MELRSLDLDNIMTNAKKNRTSKRGLGAKSGIFTLASASSTWKEDTPQKLEDALSRLDITKMQAWNDLDQLSSKTVFEGMSVDGDLSVTNGKVTLAPATIFVSLHFGKGEDAFKAKDAFPAQVFFRTTGDVVDIEDVRVNTSSFFE